jgi:DNA-binding NarL/FixJ family response regulator
MKFEITKFSRDFVARMISAKAQKTVLKEYDVLKDIEAGKSASQIAIKHNICRREVFRIKADYRK